MIEAYPLCWPVHKPRTPKNEIKNANFSSKNSDGRTRRITVYEAVNRITSELCKFTKTGQLYRIPKDSIIISTNIPKKKDGTPYSSYREPEDQGVAVYFTLDNKDYCLPCDKWDRIADNLAAIAAHLNALRGIERWGVGETHDVFTGFKALPEQSFQVVNCWHVLKLDVKPSSFDVVETTYKQLAKIYHPDMPGGNTEQMQELNEAYRIAKEIFNIK